jgi:transcriptional regulator with XRE-family HTH domain
MVKLRIQEIAESKGISLEELDQLTGFSTQNLTESLRRENVNESSNIENITLENAKQLRKKAATLGVSVLDLISPTAKKVAFNLKIIETAKNQNLNLEDLSKLSGVDPAIVAFYSTQALSREKLAEPRFQEYLNRISETLNSSIQDLQVLADLPKTKLLIEDIAQEKGITLQEMAVLMDVPSDFIDLVATQPIDTDKLLSIKENGFLRQPFQCFLCCMFSRDCGGCTCPRK